MVPQENSEENGSTLHGDPRHQFYVSSFGDGHSDHTGPISIISDAMTMTFILRLAAAMLSMMLAGEPAPPIPRLNITVYWVSDTTTYESFRLKVLNDSDSLVVIESVHPSCGCVLATVQRNLATKDNPGDIYVAVMTDRLSPEQPTAIDVFTNRNRTTPMRLNIYRGTKPDTTTMRR